MNKRKVVLRSIIVAPGFLFGFGTAVISGAEQSIQHYGSPSPAEYGFTIAIALIGIISAIIFNLIIYYVPRIFEMTGLGGVSSLRLTAGFGYSFPIPAKNLGGGHNFVPFCFMMVLHLLFVWKLMPETKRKSSELAGRSLVFH